jgi:hypothetical protein
VRPESHKVGDLAEGHLFVVPICSVVCSREAQGSAEEPILIKGLLAERSPTLALHRTGEATG